jgi:PAS domain S-box-containing protein
MGGDLIVAPAALVAFTHWPFRRAPGRALEAVVLAGLLAGITVVVFTQHTNFAYVVFPLLVWAALRFRQHGAVTAAFVGASIAVAGAVNGDTPLASGSATEVVQVLEGLLAGVTISLLILGAVLAERSSAEEELARAHAGLAEAQAVAHVGSWEWDIATDRVTWSDELYHIYGVPLGTAVDYERYVGRIHPDDRARVRNTVRAAVERGEPFAHEHRIVLDDGESRWVLGRGRPVLDARGNAIRMVGTSQDITERKRLDELRDNILATVSHELRTPLTAILGFAVTLRERGEEIPDETRREMIGHVAAQARKLERLLADLLDLDRLRAGVIRPRFRETDVGSLVEHVVAAYPSDGHPVDVRAEPVIAEVDPPKVERIVENLLANAIKHTPPATQVLVRVESHDGRVVISVDDHGRGVPPGERDAIFEIFNRGDVDAGAPGAGVGLSLVAQFAALHAGEVWVEENEEGGASFRVSLPLQAAE